jgi:putative selenium metabolism hydrolase
MARVIREVEKLNHSLESDSFLGKGSVAVTEVNSTSPSLCAVPDGAEIHLDRRLTEGETRETAMDEVQGALARAGCPDGTVTLPRYEEKAFTGLVYPMEKYYPTWVLEESSPWLTKARETYQALFRKEPVVDKWTFSTNGVTIAGLHGIPCIGFGPGEEPQAHAPDESCPIAHLGEAAAFYAAFTAHLQGKE